MAETGRKWWGRLLQGVALTLALLCLLSGAFAWWLLGTTSGARWLIGSALPYAQQHLPNSMQLYIEGIKADTIASLHIQRLTLADNEGVWFEGNNIALAWRPTALWRGVLHVNDVSAQRLHYIRAPIEADREEISPQERIINLRKTAQQLPNIFSGKALPSLRLDRLMISELATDSATYTLSGNADLIRRPLQLNLTLKSIEGIETSATIAFDAQSGTVAAQWREASGGLLGKLLALHPPAPLNAEITSSISGDMVIANLHSMAGETPLLTGKISLPLTAESAMSADFQLANPALLQPLENFQHPINLTANLKDSILALTLTTGQALGLRNISLESQLEFADEMKLSANGHAEMEDSKPLELQLQAAFEDDTLELTRLLATMPDTAVQATGKLYVEEGDAQLAGTITLPQLDARFEGEGSDLFTTPQGQLELVAQTLKMPLPAPFDQVLTAPLTMKAETQESGETWPDIVLKVESAHINGEGMMNPNAQQDQVLAQAKLLITGLPQPLTLSTEYRAPGYGYLNAVSRSLSTEAEYKFDRDVLYLDDINAKIGETIRLGGIMIVNMSDPQVQARLHGDFTSTQPLRDLGLEIPLLTATQGAGIFVDIENTDNGQKARFDVMAGNMAINGTPLFRNAIINTEATIPKDGEIQFAGFTHIDFLEYPVKWDNIRLEAAGTPKRLNWTLNAKNNSPATTLSADGELRLAEAIVLLLNSLNAHWQENRLKLQKPAELSYTPDKITLNGLDLRLNDSAHLLASASLSTQKSEGNVEIANLPVKSLPFGNTAMLEGVVNGKLAFSGAPSNPRAELQMELGGLQQNYPAMTALHKQELTLNLRGNLQNHTLTANLSANAPDSASFAEANATLPAEASLHPKSLHFAPKGTLDASLNADLMLAPFLPLFLPDGVYGTGHLVADMTMKGALDGLNLQGSLVLDSGRIEILQAGTVLSDIHLRATAKGQRFTIAEGRATDGGKGTASLQGTLDLTPTLPMNIQAGVKHFVALRHDAVIATLSGDTTLKGDLFKAESIGNWQIKTAQIAIQPSGKSDIPELRVIEVTSLDAPVGSPQENDTNEQTPIHEEHRLERPFSRNLLLDHKVTAENQIFLEGFGLNAELKGDVAVTGTAARPQLAGKMETLRGRWEFFGRTFNITRGEARISEGNLAAPLINIRAETEADDVTAIAQITGTTSNPKIEFTSIPALPQDEVLARVMFGRNLKSISPYQALQLADMLRSLRAGGGGTSINPLSKLQHTLGIDELKINNESGNGEDMTVGVGKYLKENVYLEVEGGAGQESGKVSVEVDLTPNVSVSTETRQTADSAVRLNYKHDY